MTEKDIKKLNAKSKRYSVNCGESLYLEFPQLVLSLGF